MPDASSEPYYEAHGATVYAGDCLHILRELPDASVDAVVTDPPYSLSFMGKSWDEHGDSEDAGMGYWLAGFIDGEGCFTVKGHSRGTYAPSFAVKLRRDDRAALVAAQRFVGAGTVVDVESGDASSPQVRWAIQDRDGCQRLVDILDKYPLRAKKRVDYLSWRDAVCEWTDRPRGNRWHGAADQTRMASLRDRTASVKVYTDVPWSGNDFQDWCRLWATECLRVLKPGGHLLAFGGTRTWHRLACAIEDAGFEVRDSIAWMYGSGFPKSLDVSKAIDKAAGATREVVGASPFAARGSSMTGVRSRDGQSDAGYRPEGEPYPGEASRGPITAPATPDAAQWAGWGTALKPAFEPIVVARKPLAGTVAANVLAHGTGALNVDGCRIGTDDVLSGSGTPPLQYGGTNSRPFHAEAVARGVNQNPAGRWPANVVLDDHAAAELDAQSGERPGMASQRDYTARTGTDGTTTYGRGVGRLEPGTREGFNDTGGASRFYYTAKADATERPNVAGVRHPTVKPLDLMRWLVRLVTPPGGVVLEPFAGSGTTVEAALLEGFRCIAIEREADYLPLIVARITRQRDPVAHVRLVGDPGLTLFDTTEGIA